MRSAPESNPVYVTDESTIDGSTYTNMVCGELPEVCYQMLRMCKPIYEGDAAEYTLTYR